MNPACLEQMLPSILIADDDVSTRMLLRATITQWNYPVVEACDGEEAWDILQKPHGPRIVTADWMMPKIDGLNLCRLAKKLPEPPYMILLTNMSGSLNVIHALDSGADDFLTKPFNFAELRSRITVGHRIINVTNKLERAMQDQNIGPKTQELLKIMDRMTEINQMIEEQLYILNGHMKNIFPAKSEGLSALQNIVQDIQMRHKQLKDDMKQVGDIIENK